jgi:transposase
MPTKASIYAHGNPQLLKLFETAGHPTRVLCVALDFAKAQHTALFCNGRGDILKGAFALDNSSAGAAQLLEQVRRCIKQRQMDSRHVFFGGEDCPSYAENFLRRLRQEQYLVMRVNAWEAKQQRSNFQASSDTLDLLGIAKCLLNRRAEPVVDLPAAYANLRIATEDRDALVKTATATSNRIHSYVDRLFPGFLDAGQSGLTPFGQASLDLMIEGFSPAQVRRRPRRTLGQWLGRRGVEHPQAVAGQLKDLAKGVLPPAPEQTVMLQRSLAELVKLYRGLEASVSLLDRELAYWLARTPGALLTSIGGIGVTLAAGWMAQLGPPSQWRAVPRLCSYAGVVPKTEQTGGPDQAPRSGHVQQRCNKRLKNVVLQTVEKVRQYGPEELRRTAQALEAQGAHTAYGLAKRLVRLCKYLVTTGTLYRPKPLMAADTAPATLAAYYQAAWDKLLVKWKNKADLQDVFAPQHPLGQWRAMAQALYALELRLPQQRVAAAPAGALTP